MKNLKIFTLLILTTITFNVYPACYSNAGNLNGDEICEVENCTNANNPDLCYDIVTGVPINDHSYLLVVLGGISALWFVIKKRAKNQVV